MKVNNLLSILSFLFLIQFQSCVPREQVVFKSVKNLTLDVAGNGQPVLRGEAVFFNPNKIQTKLKEIKVTILVDGKNAAVADQVMDILVPRQSDFTVPIEAKLDLKEFGLLDAVFGFLGGKSYQIQMTGYLRVNVHGVTVKVPVKYNEAVKLNR